MARRDDIARAHQIATELERDGFDVKSGGVVLAMALGILAESDPRGHRNLRSMSDGMLKAAQVAFDGLRQHRKISQ
jgi:hypothetical protein